MKRLFLAIKLIPDKNTLGVLNKLQHSLSNDRIRWVDKGNLHLTLKFFGNTSEEKISIITDTVQVTLEPFNRINLKLENAGVFGSRYKPRVIWFGVSHNEQLLIIANQLLNNLNKVGFLRDRQNFVPHITVGRITKIADKKHFNNEMKKFESVFLQNIIINEIILYESVLTSKGPIYNIIKSFSLVG